MLFWDELARKENFVSANILNFWNTQPVRKRGRSSVSSAWHQPGGFPGSVLQLSHISKYSGSVRPGPKSVAVKCSEACKENVSGLYPNSSE